MDFFFASTRPCRAPKPMCGTRGAIAFFRETYFLNGSSLLLRARGKVFIARRSVKGEQKQNARNDFRDFYGFSCMFNVLSNKNDREWKRCKLI